jgi:NAD-dependent deacetylase
MEDIYVSAAKAIKSAQKASAFTGAGISIESGIPPFRGEDGLWNKFDPIFLDISYFQTHPAESWALIKEIFYDFFGRAKPNAAHYALARMEQEGLLDAIITQNIDNLHQRAGSKIVYEFHGTSQRLVCMDCGRQYPVSEIKLNHLPPLCAQCNGLLKPAFVFFGEPIPEPAMTFSLRAAETSDVFILIGTTGEIMPASMIPLTAKEKGAIIIEINPHESKYTHKITDIFLNDKATRAFAKLSQALQQLQ